ncbi:MAG: hypothetical protein ACFFBV_01560 [Promethearchaeota archaeon]
MHTYLGQHPDIFMCEPKEPYYFLTDMPHKDRFNAKAYFALFKQAKNVKYAGESSVVYLYSRTAASKIHSFCPTARIIIMLRNPIDLLYSLHHQLLHIGNEDIFDFAEALAVEPDRAAGKRIPSSASFPHGLLYRKIVDFPPQITRYFNAFGRDAVKIIIFDDFFQDAAREYQQTLQWLGLRDDVQVDLNIRNIAQPLPNLVIQRFLRRNAVLRLFRAAMHRLVPNSIIAAVQRAIGAATQKQRPKTMNSELRARLQEELRPQVEQLSKLIGRDLTHWCRSP